MPQHFSMFFYDKILAIAIILPNKQLTRSLRIENDVVFPVALSSS
jgi:hypothetical protein